MSDLKEALHQVHLVLDAFEAKASPFIADVSRVVEQLRTRLGVVADHADAMEKDLTSRPAAPTPAEPVDPRDAQIAELQRQLAANQSETKQANPPADPPVNPGVV